ncbi:NAD(P)-dependent oxidoreductase [soil metagenome]|uniref:NAD-dependent epimerase/dehydratase family protein n=1 Tax=Sphingobium sp. BS19 TaxID=3018973 RepID=UPI0022EF00CD|nr:NAD(P)-dependent oxidoreductase [Sphingobium sp. BS19]GLI99974.1 NAD-dependent dehydratase [Sphingobium sp. BS19]
MKSRHIITGGAGFVGQRLATALRAQGEDVVIFDTVQPTCPGVLFVHGDVRNMADIARLALGSEDRVYHLAARQFHGAVPRHDREEWFAEVNTQGTRNILDCMRQGGATRLIFFSTDMTYGRPTQSPVPDTHCQRPIGPYGHSKLAAEQWINNAVCNWGLSATIFRPRLIAGAGRLGILTKLFMLIQHGLPVPMIGSGCNRYQMIAVDDCVSAALHAAKQDFPCGAFNLGSSTPPTVKSLLQGLIEQSGSRSILVPTPARLVQAVLAGMDRAGMTLLYPEQFAIADADYVLDTTGTATAMKWSPSQSDGDILYAAYRHFQKAKMRKLLRSEPSSTSGLAP